MDKNSPTEKEWRELYAVTDRIKEAAPWEGLDETDLFAVENPETGEVGFVSVMGTLGEHYAVAVYLGVEGLYGFWDMQDAGPYLTPEMVLGTPQLQASFEDRNTLHQKDRDVIKKLGLKYRGRNAWPQFQSFGPGLVPWYLTGAEARFLTHALEQTLVVVARLDDEPALLDTDDDESYLFRVPTSEDGKWVWHDEIRPAPPPGSREVPLYMDRQALEFLEKLPPTKGTLDLDFFWAPTPVLDEGERPYYPYMLLIIDPDSGMILGNETMIAVPSFEEMWGRMPMKVAQTLARLQLRPGTIRTPSESVEQFLGPLADYLNIKLQVEDDLSELESVEEMLIGFLMR